MAEGVRPTTRVQVLKVLDADDDDGEAVLLEAMWSWRHGAGGGWQGCNNDRDDDVLNGWAQAGILAE